MIGQPYRWQCEAERCYRQRDRAGRWHARGRDMGTDDPGEGNRYHPECHPRPTLELYPEAWQTVGRWQVRRVSLVSVQVAPLYRAGGSDCAIRWPDGRVAYDWPERCPLYVRRYVARILGGIAPMA